MRSARRQRLHISKVRFTAADPVLMARGLVGFVCCTVDGALRLDGIAVRRTRDGRSVLSFPARLDDAGREHALFYPINDHARRHIEHAVFRALDRQEAHRR